MQFAQLRDEQTETIRRYARCVGPWRWNSHKSDRSFASLEYDMAAGYEVLADGIVIDGRPGYRIIVGDAKDPEFFRAIFHHENSAITNMRVDDLAQLRRYIVDGEGELPMPPTRLLEADLAGNVWPPGDFERGGCG